MNKFLEKATPLRVKPWQTNRRAIELAKRRSVSESGLVFTDGLNPQPNIFDIGLYHEDSVPVAFVPSGTVFVGSLKEAAVVWLKGDMTLEATTAHEDYFSKQMAALRAQQRIAVTVLRPQSFFTVKVRTWPRRLRNFFRRPKHGL
jgi:hypothetical protein